MLFIFRAHSSPVTSVNFSPSGKYLISASDYGERRLMMWNARSPVYKDAVQLPHMIFWTEDGLIKKLLFCKDTPDKHFWLTMIQLGQLPEDELVMTWPGETDNGDDIESDSDSDAEDDDGEFDEEDDFGKDDIREVKGATVGVIMVDKEGDKVEATEYIAGGGTLVITLQSIFEPIAEAFVSVNLKEQQYDLYGTQSGDRVGTFKAADPIPWREYFTDPLNLKPPYRMPPKTVTETCERKAFVYKEHRKFDKVTGEEIFDSVAVEMLWTCPPPNMGPVVVNVNFRLRSENFRRKLTYSLKESPIRMNTLAGDDVVAEDGARFLFDQEERHMVFFRFIQDRNWEAVASFLEKKCFIYFEGKRFIRRRRTIEMLQRMFGKTKKVESIVAGVDSSDVKVNHDLSEEENLKLLQAKHEEKRREEYLDKLSQRPIIVASPFIHEAGHTRSSVMCENLDVFADKVNIAKQAELELQAKKKRIEEKKARRAAKREEKKRLREERKHRKELEAAEETDEQRAARELKQKQKAELNEELSKDVSSEDDSESDSDDSSSDSSGSYETDSDGSDSGSGSYETDSSGSYETDTDYTDDSGRKLPPILEDEEMASPLSKQDSKKIDSSESQNRLAIETSDSVRLRNEVSSPTKSDNYRPSTGLDDDTVSSNSDDSSKAGQTLRDALQVLPRIIYTQPVEGEDFDKNVKKIAKQEGTQAYALKLLGYPNPKELREHTSKGQTAQSLLAWGNAPQWVSEKVEEATAKREAERVELEAQSDMGARGVPSEGPDVKDGMFGPRFDGLNMKLPGIYPHKAGKRIEAVKDALKKNEKSVRKEKKRRIPTPEEALELYEAKKKKKMFTIRKPSYFRNRDAKKQEAQLLEEEIKLNVLVTSGYPTARRKSMPMLPGMSEHYPNPAYNHGALIPNGYQPKDDSSIKPKASVLSSIFKKTDKKTYSKTPLLITNNNESVTTSGSSVPATSEERNQSEDLKVSKKLPIVGNKPLSYSTVQKKEKPKKSKKKKEEEEQKAEMSVENENDQLSTSDVTAGSRRNSRFKQIPGSRRSSRSRVSIASQLSHFHSHVSFGSSSVTKQGEINSVLHLTIF